MHFTLTYDLGASGNRRTEIETEIDKILKPYNWAKRLTTFYIVKIDNQSEWDKILQQLQDLSKSITEKFHFIMSPVMDGGNYNGILKKGSWDNVNKISKS